MNNDENNELQSAPVGTEAELASNAAEANASEITSEGAEVVNDENQEVQVDPDAEVVNSDEAPVDEEGAEVETEPSGEGESEEVEDPFKGKELFGVTIAYSRPQIVEGVSRTFIMCDNGNTFLFSTEELESALNKGDLR